MQRLTVLVGAFLLAGCTSGGLTHPASQTPGGPSVPLVGTEWQLVSYQDAGATPVGVHVDSADSTIRFNGKGQFSAHACNYYGGNATIDGQRITFSAASGTMMACGGEAGDLERRVTKTIDGLVTWSISGRRLSLTDPEGRVLTYRVRPSIYPDVRARTIETGSRAGGQYRLAVDGPSKNNPHLYIVFEMRTAPGEAWGEAGVASPGKGDCLADSVIGGVRLGAEKFVATWATPDVARVTTQARKGAPETTLRFYAVPGSTLRIAAAWVTTFHPSVSPVTFYDAHGKVIAAYPNGPCNS